MVKHALTIGKREPDVAFADFDLRTLVSITPHPSIAPALPMRK